MPPAISESVIVIKSTKFHLEQWRKYFVLIFNEKSCFTQASLLRHYLNHKTYRLIKIRPLFICIDYYFYSIGPRQLYKSELNQNLKNRDIIIVNPASRLNKRKIDEKVIWKGEQWWNINDNVTKKPMYIRTTWLGWIGFCL